MAIHPSYRDLRLDGPVAEVRQAGDPLRFDTNPGPLDHRHPAHQHPAPARPNRRQARLSESAPPQGGSL